MRNFIRGYLGKAPVHVTAGRKCQSLPTTIFIHDCVYSAVDPRSVQQWPSLTALAHAFCLSCETKKKAWVRGY